MSMLTKEEKLEVFNQDRSVGSTMPIMLRQLRAEDLRHINRRQQ